MKKQKQRVITKPIKKNYKKKRVSVTEIFQKMKKLKKKKEVMLTIETKIKKMKIEKKKECLNNCNYKKIIISFN